MDVKKDVKEIREKVEQISIINAQIYELRRENEILRQENIKLDKRVERLEQKAR